MALPRSYIVLDTETTGLSRFARVIELAAVRVDNGVITDKRSQLFDPGMPIPREITALTGITNDMVCGKATACAVLPRFLEFVDGLPIVGHNVSFDLARLRYEAELAGIRMPLVKGADTMLLARRRVKLPTYSLHALVDHFHIENLPTHRALADVYATQVLYELLLTMP